MDTQTLSWPGHIIVIFTVYVKITTAYPTSCGGEGEDAPLGVTEAKVYRKPYNRLLTFKHVVGERCYTEVSNIREMSTRDL